MKTKLLSLADIAYSRSGDKGSNANIGVIAYTEKGFAFLDENLKCENVELFFSFLKPFSIHRYTLPNLWALNFVLNGILAGGGSRSLRSDAQGKALGQAILEMPIDVPLDLVNALIRSKYK